MLSLIKLHTPIALVVGVLWWYAAFVVRGQIEVAAPVQVVCDRPVEPRARLHLPWNQEGLEAGRGAAQTSCRLPCRCSKSRYIRVVVTLIKESLILEHVTVGFQFLLSLRSWCGQAGLSCEKRSWLEQVACLCLRGLHLLDKRRLVGNLSHKGELLECGDGLQDVVVEGLERCW